MAGKPFLSRLKKRKKSYDVTHSDGNSQSAANKEMAGRYRSSSSSNSAGGDAPPPKKRKTEEETVEEEEWDDFDVTQADLEDLEIQASQAYAGVPASQQPTRQQHSEPQPSTSRTFDRPSTDTSGRFVKPTLSSHSTSSSSSGQSHGRLSNQSHPPSQNGRGSRQLSVNSSSSLSSSSTNPKSLTCSEGSRTSLSIHSGSSEEIPLAQGHGSLSRGMSSESNYSIDVTGILGRDHADMSHGADSSRIRQETAGFQKQIDDMRSELYAKEGEIKILRDKLSGQESELHKMKSEKIGQIAQQNKQQKEKEKGLQDEVSRLKDRYDFSEHEKRVLESRCRDLEAQIKLLQAGPTASQALPPTQTSPTPRRVPVERKTSPKISSSFPSKSSFHANEASPRKQIKGDSPRKLTKGEDPVRTSSAMVQTVEAAKGRQSRRRNHLNVATSCKSSGSQLVARLLHITPSNVESPSNRGIAGLLHTPAASTTVESVSFDRDKDTSLLSPCRKRISDVQALLEAQEKPETSSIVSQDHFYIAIHGLTQILQADDNNGALVSENGASVSEELSPAIQANDNAFDSAVLVLPLLKDYLSHYLRMLETSTDSFEASPSISSSSSGSFESSVESSLGLFLKDSTAYANNLESLALASLRTLHILTMCRSVRNVLLSSHSTEEISDSSGSNSSGGSKSEKPSTSVEKIEHRTRLPKEYLQNLNMLRLLVKLADPGSKGHLFNVEIVETSLSTLTLLANHATEQQIPSLLPLISDEVLHNCLECESEPTVICRCLQLLRSLVRSNAIVSGLCANASECVLLCLYHVSTNKKFYLFSCDIQLQITEQVINLLSDIASLHKGGLTILLESDCICSVEVVQTIVTLLYNILKLHEKENSSSKTPQKVTNSSSLKADKKSFSILQKGTLLLHQMYQHEMDFVRRHSSVQHQYVLLIQQLSRIFRDAGGDQYEDEISAVQDLWDFSPDEEDYESSHDTSQEEINMDTS